VIDMFVSISVLFGDCLLLVLGLSELSLGFYGFYVCLYRSLGFWGLV
jgi:hypothetical protein